MQKITPCIWFNDNVEEAVNFYLPLFKNSKILATSRYDKASAEVSGRPEGSVLTIEFELDGQAFTALNGGPVFKLTPAISFVINCETQDEVDHFWNAMSAVPQAEQCGWLTDKFGVSWQVVPTVLGKLLSDPDPVKAGRVMQAMLEMKKLIIADLQSAYDQA